MNLCPCTHYVISNNCYIVMYFLFSNKKEEKNILPVKCTFFYFVVTVV